MRYTAHVRCFGVAARTKTLRLPSNPPHAMNRESADTATARTGSAPPTVAVRSPVSASHTINAPSSPPETMVLRSAAQQAERTHERWPRKTRTGSPVTAFQVLREASCDALRTLRPPGSGEKQQADIGAVWP